MGADVVAWDDNPASRGGRPGPGPARPGGGKIRFRRPGAVARHSASPAEAPSRRATRDRGRRADPLRRRTAVPGGARLRLTRPIRRHHRHQRQIDHHRPAGPHPGAGRQSPSQPAPTSVRRRCRCRCCHMMGCTCSKCPPICWSDSRRIRFDVAVMLNLSADHIDRHGDMAGYAMAKRAIFDRQTRDDLAVIGIDDAGSRDMAAWLDTRPARVVRVSGADVPLASGPALPGAHNAQNAAAATAMARFFGVSDDAIASGLRQLPRPAAPPAAHRHDRRRDLHQRQQGDQRRRIRTRAGLLRPADLDRRRHGEGRRDRAAGAALPAHRPRPC